MLKLGFRSLVSIAGVALVTFAAYRVFQVNATTAGFAYLLLVLVIASTWGFTEACLASVAATLLLNLCFLPPIGKLTIYDTQNWVALFSFLATSLIASRLSAKAERRTQDAIARRQDVERLYTFSRAILLIEEGEPFPKQLARRLAEIFPVDAVVLYDRRTDEIHRAGPAEFDGLDDQLRDAARHGGSFADTEQRRVITAVRLGSEPIAALGIQGARMPDSVLQGIANLVAIGLERARAQDLAHQIEAARRSEQLRTTLLDALAHEFKTPLTSIKAATTSLLANPGSAAGEPNRAADGGRRGGATGWRSWWTTPWRWRGFPMRISICTRSASKSPRSSGRRWPRCTAIAKTARWTWSARASLRPSRWTGGWCGWP